MFVPVHSEEHFEVWLISFLLLLLLGCAIYKVFFNQFWFEYVIVFPVYYTVRSKSAIYHLKGVQVSRHTNGGLRGAPPPKKSTLAGNNLIISLHTRLGRMLDGTTQINKIGPMSPDFLISRYTRIINQSMELVQLAMRNNITLI